MKAQSYLENRLKSCTYYTLTEEDRLLMKNFGLEEFIYKKLTSKKFRKWAIDESSRERIRIAIKLNISKNRPIQFTFPFGGYKLWRFPSYPEVDWAEFFTISYYCEYIAPILQAYKPGVSFYFSSDDIIVERMDNVPVKDTDAYFESFNILLNYFRKHFPKNMNMEIRRVSDLYPNKNEFEKDLQKNIEEVSKQYKTWDKEKKEKMLRTSELNIYWRGVENWTRLSEEAKKNKIEMGPIYHDAYTGVPRRRAFVRGDDKIVVFTTLIPNAIAVGTTKTSVTKFWTGFGVLEKTPNSYLDRILSPEQWLLVKNEKHNIEGVDLIQLRNFDNIWIYDKHFDFRKV